MPHTITDRIQKMRQAEKNPGIALLQAIEEMKAEMRTIMEREKTALQSQMETKIMAFTAEIRQELQHQSVTAHTLRQMDTIRGADGHNPLTVSSNPPSNPQEGDLWFQP